MSGHFFDPTPTPPKHRCNLPTYGGINKGWRCDCGKAYVVEYLPDRDTNPGEDPWQWRRAPGYDRTPQDNP